MTHQGGGGGGDAQGEEGDTQWQEHGPEGAEGQDQHDCGRDQTEDLARTSLRGASLAEGVPAELDLKRARADVLADRLDRLDLGELQLKRLLREVDDCVGDLVVLAHLRGTEARRLAGRAEGRGDAGDRGELGDLGEHRLDPRLVLGEGAARDVENNLVRVTRLLGEARGEKRLCVGGVGARESEVVRVGRSRDLGCDVYADEQDNPCDEHEPSASNAQAGEGLHWGCLQVWNEGGPSKIMRCTLCATTLGEN